MTATALPTVAVPTGRTRTLPVARELAFAEARRIAAHPLVLLGAALYSAMITVSSAQGPGSGYDGLLTGPTFFLGVFTYFAANLAATRPQRSGALDEHSSFPAPTLARTAGLCLAALGPVVLAAVLMAAIMAWYAAGRVDLPVWPSAPWRGGGRPTCWRPRPSPAFRGPPPWEPRRRWVPICRSPRSPWSSAPCWP
ncbi:MAG: hypothetical protein M3Q47_12825 [Actinomycetota bacterium]|nr:hypothetical protein [Actinomycetota bacterium]